MSGPLPSPGDPRSRCSRRPPRALGNGPRHTHWMDMVSQGRTDGRGGTSRWRQRGLTVAFMRPGPPPPDGSSASPPRPRREQERLSARAVLFPWQPLGCPPETSIPSEEMAGGLGRRRLRAPSTGSRGLARLLHLPEVGTALASRGLRLCEDHRRPVTAQPGFRRPEVGRRAGRGHTCTCTCSGRSTGCVSLGRALCTPCRAPTGPLCPRRPAGRRVCCAQPGGRPALAVADPRSLPAQPGCGLEPPDQTRRPLHQLTTSGFPGTLTIHLGRKRRLGRATPRLLDRTTDPSAPS